jgi:site-specific DNA recombinase
MAVPTSMIAVLIARVSSKGQEEEGFSLEAQVKILTNYCGPAGLRIGKTFKIAESASKSEQRKIFKEAMDYVAKHDVKHLVVEKVDRHVRNLHDAVDTYDWLMADEERRVHFVKDSLVMHQKSRSQEWLNWGIRVVMAKNYIDNLREETTKGTYEKLAQGWLPGTPPPGYMHVVRDGKKIQDFNPDTKKSMQRIFQLLLEPQHSVETIRHKMFEFGITTGNGRKFAKSQTHRILKNPFYIGTIQWDGKEYPGKQPHLIDDKLFYAVQAKLERRTPEKYRKHNPVLKGIMRCEHCSKTITWQRQKGRLYGGCQRKTVECKKQKFVREDAVMTLIERRLDDLICPAPQVVDWLVTLLQQDFQLSIDNTEQAQKALDDRIARIKRMDDMLYDDKLAGLVSAERYQEKHDGFMSELNGLEKQKGGVSQKYEEKYMKGISDIELSQDAKRLFADANVTNDDKRVILTKLFASISLKDNIVSVTYTKLAQAIAQKSVQTREILGYAG